MTDATWPGAEPSGLVPVLMKLCPETSAPTMVRGTVTPSTASAAVHALAGPGSEP